MRHIGCPPFPGLTAGAGSPWLVFQAERHLTGQGRRKEHLSKERGTGPSLDPQKRGVVTRAVKHASSLGHSLEEGRRGERRGQGEKGESWSREWGGEEGDAAAWPGLRVCRSQERAAEARTSLNPMGRACLRIRKPLGRDSLKFYLGQGRASVPPLGGTCGPHSLCGKRSAWTKGAIWGGPSKQVRSDGGLGGPFCPPQGWGCCPPGAALG